MATETLYAGSVLAGAYAPNQTNLLGATTATWAGDVNTNTSQTVRVAIDNPTDPLTGGATHTVNVRARKGSNTNDPTITINLYDNGTLVGQLGAANAAVVSQTGQTTTRTFTTSQVSSGANVEIEVVMTAAGGSPSARNSAQLDYVEVVFDTSAATAPAGQAHFRLRDDSSALNTDAGWVAALDSNATIDMEAVFRARFEIYHDTGQTTAYKLQYRYQPDGGAFGAWTDVVVETGGSGNVTTERICLHPSSITDGAATTDLLAGSGGTFVAGTGEEGGAALTNATPSIVLGADEHTEVEWALRIHKWADGRLENNPNDLFELRMVTSGGTPLTNYTQTPQITVGPSVQVIGGAYSEGPARCGPFATSTGRLVVLLEYSESDARICAAISDDGGDTWTEATVTGRPIFDDLESVDGRMGADDVLRFVAQGVNSDDVDYFELDCAPATPVWDVIDESVAVGPDPLEQSCSIEVRSNGTVVAGYMALATQDHVRYRIRSAGGTWGTEQTINSGDGTNYHQVVSCLDADDVTHLFYFDDSNGQVRYRTISAADALSGEQTLATGLPTATADRQPIVPPVAYLDGTDRVVSVAFKNASDVLVERRSVNGGAWSGPSTISGVTVAKNSAAGFSRQAQAALVSNGAELHAVYADAATLDLWRDEDTGGGWGTDVEILDGATVHWVRAEKFQHSAGNGSGHVVGMFVDNGSGGGAGYGIYREYALSLAGVSIEVQPAPVTTAAVAVTPVQPAPVVVAVLPAVVAASAVAVTPAVAAVAVAVQPAVATVAAVAVSVQAAVVVAVQPAAVSTSAVAVIPVRGVLAVPAQPAAVTTSAVAVAAVQAPLAIQVQPATVTTTADAVIPEVAESPVSVAASPAAVTAAAVPVAPVLASSGYGEIARLRLQVPAAAGGVTPAAAATVTVSAVAVTPVLAPLAVEAQPAVVTTSAVAVVPVVGAVAIAVQPAVVTTAAVAVSPTTAALALEAQPAVVATAAVAVVPQVAGAPVAVAVQPATVAVTAVAVVPTQAALAVAAEPAVVAAVAQPVAVAQVFTAVFDPAVFDPAVFDTGGTVIAAQPATVTVSAVAVTPATSGVLVTVEPASVTVAAVAVTPTQAPHSHQAEPAAVTASAVAVTPTSAAVAVEAQPATVNVSAVAVAPAVGTLTLEAQPASVAVAAQTVIPVVAGAPVAVAVQPAAVTTTAAAVAPAQAPHSVQANPATVTVAALAVVPATSGVLITVAPASVTVSAEPVTPTQAPHSHQAEPAAVTASAVAVTPTSAAVAVEAQPASVTTAAVAATPTQSAFSLQAQPATVTVTAKATTFPAVFNDHATWVEDTRPHRWTGTARPHRWTAAFRPDQWATSTRPTPWQTSIRPDRWGECTRPHRWTGSSRPRRWYETVFLREGDPNMAVDLNFVEIGDYTQGEIPEPLLVRVLETPRDSSAAPRAMDLFAQTPAWTATVTITGPGGGAVVTDRTVEIVDPADMAADYPDDVTAAVDDTGWLRMAWAEGDLDIVTLAPGLDSDYEVQIRLDNGVLRLKSTDIWRPQVRDGVPLAAVGA